MNLFEWSEIYIKHRDVLLKKLVKLEIKKDVIECKYRDSEVKYIIMENLEQGIIERISKGNIFIVCLNTKKNIDFIIKNWKKFIDNRNLKIIFSSPEKNDKWILSPWTHNNIADNASLKSGLYSLSDSIEKANE